ncbi:formylglycine-generating enzyme family protein [Spirulina subsalsa]|uniref:formylglycine-generating enzyme family protein n=1 Tax=Spirulina subsalsa TaxID=54311 RepID=UPI00030C069D|nr:formylglycine-generating enzyme family protein [Spirulina subsalsa]
MSTLQTFTQRHGQLAHTLACHAAFPLALTPELLYCLRENFVPESPWINVADILLTLCDPVGHRLYEMPTPLRHQLLQDLKTQWGAERLHTLSDFMVVYIRATLPSNERIAQDLGAAPHWTALAYTQPNQATQTIAQTLKNALTQTPPQEWLKITNLLETYSELDPLLEAGFQPLLDLSRAYEAQAQGDTTTAQQLIQPLGRPGETVEIAGVSFQLPILLETVTFEIVQVNRRGEIIQREKKSAPLYREQLGDSVELEMMAIPGGTFLMGSPEGEGNKGEHPQHSVTVAPFFMGKTPITQAQWRAVVTQVPPITQKLDPNPSGFKGDNRPVEQVSWKDAIEFCARLTQLTGKDYRLPSEAEWEYACRAGTTTPFYFGETITTALANYDGNYTFADEPKGEYREETTPVGSFPPNAFGLYDLHGNLYEWCLDDWHNNYEGAPSDGRAWIDNDNHSQTHQEWLQSMLNKKSTLSKLLRGGCWYDSPKSCRSASRGIITRDYEGIDIGFRVVVPRTP